MPRTRTKSEFVSNTVPALELVKRLSDALKGLGGNDDDLHQIIISDAVARQVAELLIARQPQTFNLFVDYSRSLAEVVAAGNYSLVADRITEENFPTDRNPKFVGNPTGVNVTQAVLVHLGLGVSSYYVLSELEQRGLRPGTMFELAHFGEQYPDIQSFFQVIALGSIWDSPGVYSWVGGLWGGRWPPVVPPLSVRRGEG